MKGKVALVTGGGSGIGAACCRALAAEGVHVLVSDLDLDAATAMASELNEAGQQGSAYGLDVSSEQGWVGLVEQIGSEVGQLDILVNNAGILAFGTAEDMDFETWRKIMSVNVDGTFLGIRECMKLMRQSGGGVIVNISSISGIVGDAMLAAYNASKGAVRLLTKSAALHGATLDEKIRVNSVHPGFVATPMTANLAEQADEGFAEMMQARIPLGYVAEPEDIANAVVFLSSEKARYMTGSELVVDGGFTAW